MYKYLALHHTNKHDVVSYAGAAVIDLIYASCARADLHRMAARIAC